MRSLLFAFLLALLGCAASRPPVTLCARLEGAGPSSDALDPEHHGLGVFRLERTSIRFDIRAPGLEQVIATHIHHGEAGVNGPMLWEINSGYRGDSIQGVAREIPPGVIALVASEPSEYYLKLHSLKFPGGAIRGQLGPCGGVGER